MTYARLILAVLVLPLVAIGTGCGGEGATAVRFRWTLQYAGDKRPGTLDCDQADARNVLFAVRVDSDKGPNPETIVDCRAKEAVVSGLSEGRFSVWAMLIGKELPTGPSRDVSMFSGDLAPVSTKAGTTVDVDVVLPISYFDLQWKIERSGVPLSCEEAGAKTVEIITEKRYRQARQFSMPCVGNRGLSGPAPAEYYDALAFALRDENGRAISPRAIRRAGQVSFGPGVPVDQSFTLGDGRSGFLSVTFDLW